MLARIRKAQEENEGFTLIELLVVIIIIGILAAIAIPVFLNQRNKGYDAQAKSDVRQLATLEETYLTDNNVYGTYANLTADFKPSATTSGFTATPTGSTKYSIKVTSQSTNNWCLDSDGSGGKGVYKC
jgi:type IV pilus assembly protein PilA